jgi:hypothetical protein
MSVTAATAMMARMILGDRLRRMGAESLRGFTPGDGGRSGVPISCAQSVWRQSMSLKRQAPAVSCQNTLPDREWALCGQPAVAVLCPHSDACP